MSDPGESGVSIPIRIMYEDTERLKTLKLSPEEPWHKVVKRVLDEHAAYKMAEDVVNQRNTGDEKSAG